jgi:autotransporter-associated beta strand protein
MNHSSVRAGHPLRSFSSVLTAAGLLLLAGAASDVQAQQHTWASTSNTEFSSGANWSPTMTSGGLTTSQLLLSSNGSLPNPVLNASDLKLLTLTFEGSSSYSLTTTNNRKFIFENAGAGIINNTALAQNISLGMIEAVKDPITFNSSVAGGSLNITVSQPDGIKLLNALTVTGSGNTNITGAITGSGTTAGLIKNGTGTLTLNSINTYGGATTLNAGVLRLNHASSLPSGNLLINGGVLGLGAGNFTRALGTGANQFRFGANGGGFAAYGADRLVNIGNASAQMTWDGANFVPAGAALILGANDSTHTVTFQNPIALGAANRTIEVRNGSAAVDGDLSGILSGTGGLVKTGAGTLRLTAANTYQGPTTVSAGTLEMGGTNRLLTSTEFDVASGATFALNGNSTAVGSLAGAGAVSLASGTLTVGSNGFSTSFTGNITGTGGLTKVGAGTLTMGGGAKSFSGTTAIDAGKLVVNTSLAGALTLGSNGTLGGAGSFNALTWNDGGKIAFSLGQNALTVSNTLTRGSVGGAYLFDFLGTGEGGLTYPVMAFNSTSFSVSDFSYTNLGGDATGGTFAISGNQLYFTAIPEPSTYAAIFGALALLCAFVYRRRMRK